MANRGSTHSAIIIRIAGSLGLAVAFSSCSATNFLSKVWHCDLPSLWGDKTLVCLQMIEEEAAQYGTVSAGAPRAALYENDSLKESRRILKNKLGDLREELKGDPNPQTVRAQIVSTLFDLALQMGKTIGTPSGETKGTGDSSNKQDALLKEVQKDFADKISQVLQSNVSPDRIGMIGLRMAELKFIESEIEDLQLVELHPVDKNQRRVVVSLNLTAWVRDPASSVIVYVDLHPLGGDHFCHEAGPVILAAWLMNPENQRLITSEDMREKIDKIQDERLPEPLRQYVLVGNRDKLAGYIKGLFQGPYAEEFAPFEEMKEELLNLLRTNTTPKDLHDEYAACHLLLTKLRILPNLIHVERLGEKEYLIAAGIEESQMRARLEGKFGGADPTLEGGYTAGKVQAEKTAKLWPINLAFAAGNERAGWFFMPAPQEGGRMQPTERRLRMVVDVHRSVERLSLHVHKIYLDKSFQPLRASSFVNQMGYLNLVRWRLNEAEKDYIKIRKAQDDKVGLRAEIVSFPERPNWELIKSRMRNLLYQGWSEALIVSVPSESKDQPLRYAIHAKVVTSEGSDRQYVVIDGSRIVSVERARPKGIRVYAFDGYIYPGFIDTHNHPHYNFISRWIPPKAPRFESRYEWLCNKEYNERVEETKHKIDSEFLTDNAMLYAEAKAIVGGTTTLQGGEKDQKPSVLRDLWENRSATVKGLDGRILENDECKERLPVGYLTPDDAKLFERLLRQKFIKRLFIHVAEGTDDVVGGKSEFTRLQDLGLLRDGVVLIHAISLDAKQFSEVVQHDGFLVWSPKGNITLYDHTMNIKAALDAIDSKPKTSKSNIALAPDWTVMGSSTILQELKFARAYAEVCELKDRLTPKRLYRMITEDAALVAGVESEVGKIAPGYYADFILTKQRNSDPHANLLEVTEEDIKVVAIGGRPILIDDSIFESITDKIDLYPEDYEKANVGRTVKRIRLVSRDSLKVRSLEQARQQLSSAYDNLALLLEQAEDPRLVKAQHCPLKE